MILRKINNALDARFTTSLFTYKELRKMYFPLVLDQLFIFIIGVLSTAMVASSGTGAAAAVNLVNVIGNLAYAIFSAIALGGSIVVARAKGASDPERVHRAIGQSVSGCLVASLVLSILLYVFSEALIRMLYSSAEPAVIESAVEYMKVYVISFPFYAVFNAVFNAFRSLGDSKSSLVLTIVINTAHLLFSYVFINILEFSTVGAALSYLTARVLGLIFGMIWLFRQKSGIRMRPKHFLSLDREILKDIRVLGLPFALEQLLFQGGILLVQRYLSALHTIELDAYSISNSVFFLYYAFAYSITAMAGTVCGQCVGAGEIGLAKKYCKDLIRVGRFVMIFAILILMPLTPALLNLYAPAESMRSVIFFSLAIGALPMPVIWGEAFVIPTAIRTAGDTRFTSMISIVAMFLGRMGFGYLFTISFGFGVMGVWLGQFIEWLFRAVIMSIRLETDSWVRVPAKGRES